MQNDVVADRDVGPDRQREAGIGMQNAAILYVRARAYIDEIGVAAYYGIEPDARVLADTDLADDLGAGRHEISAVRREFGGKFVEGIDRHENPSFRSHHATRVARRSMARSLAPIRPSPC